MGTVIQVSFKLLQLSVYSMNPNPVWFFPRLILEWNSLGMWEEGFSFFCQGLGANNFLQRLDLRNNQINHQGAGELAVALKQNASLQELGKID